MKGRPQPTPFMVTTTSAGPPSRGIPRLSWIAYADQYFESECQPAFSDCDEDGSSDSFQEEDEVKAGASDLVGATAEEESTASSSNWLVFVVGVIII